MNRTLTFLHSLLISFVTFEELGNIASVVVADSATGLDVEYTFGGIFLGNLLGLVEQFHCFFGVIAHLYVDNVHVDGGHILIVALLLHHIEGSIEISLGSNLVTTDVVNVTKQVVGHVHLFFKVLLAQFNG